MTESLSSPLTGSHWIPRPQAIWRRYARSRLRTASLVGWIGVTLLIAGFLFFLLRTLALYRGQLGAVDAERAPLLALLILQSFILFVLGTGQVASGMTAEADEGTLDYQRLTPLSPLSKVFGFLLGLPVREWLMFAATLPFTAWAIWAGGVPARAWAPLYAVFLSSALLYHLTGLVAGTVIRNRRWAFLASIGIVFALYTVAPEAARFGLVVFKYFTLRPVLEETLAEFLPGRIGDLARMRQALAPEVAFFGLKVSTAAYTLFTQAALIVTFGTMLWRRWRRAEAHLLGKLWAVVLFAWVQVILLGNALPLITSGRIFPSRELRRRITAEVGGDWAPRLGEAIAMIGLYGFATLALIWMLAQIIAPSVDTQVRGEQRARKLSLARVPAFSDAAGAGWLVLAMGIIGAAGWTTFAKSLVESAWFPGSILPAHAAPTFALVLLGAGLGFVALVEGGGGKRAFLVILLAGVVPVMAGSILGAAGNTLLTASAWLAGISPLAAPFYAAQALVPDKARPEMIGSMTAAFWTWQAMTAVATAWLLIRLRKVRRARVAAVALVPA